MKKNISELFFLLLVLVVLYNCKKLEKVMSVSTGEVTNILANSAEASGEVIDLGDGVTQHGHCYAKIPNVTIACSKTQLGVPAGTGSFKSQLTNLEAGTKYYINTYISNGSETVYGIEISFSTIAASAPSLTTSPVISISTNTASCGGDITSDGGAPVTARGVCWSTSSSPLISDNKTTDASGIGNFTSSLTGLLPGTTYYVRAYATNGAGTSYGNEFSFATSAELPTLTTTSASEITDKTVNSGGNITSDGGASVTARGVCWSTFANPTIDDNTILNGTGSDSFVSHISGLTSNTTYYIKAFATNSVGTAYGNQVTFTTTITLPTLTTDDVSAVTATTATSGGNITSQGGASVTARGVCWGITTNPTIDNSKTNDGSEIGSFISSITGLTHGTTYYVRAYATNIGGTAYGNEVSFTSAFELPALTTLPITSVTATAAIGGGNITNNGGDSIIVRGLCWNITGNPTFDKNVGYTTDGSGIGNYTSQLTALQTNTIYYVRAYAVTDYGIGYGNEIIFLTKGLPEVMVAEVSEITDIGAVCGGEVTNDWGFPVTTRGVCWNKTGNSTLESNEGFTEDGSGTGTFTSYLTGLINGTTYYVVAYATNSLGTSYSEERIFEATKPFECGTSTITDNDGNIYNTVKIGSQCWMKENLKTTHYADGTALVDGTGVGDISGDFVTKYWFIYQDNNLSNKDIYGLLYTWAAAMNGASGSDANPSGVQGVCPTGWHLPSDAEWKQMEMHLGMSQAEADRKGWRGTDEGGKLKETGTTHWLSPNTGATNESGFSGLPGGYRYSAGPVFNLGYFGYWWSSLEDAFYRDLNYNLTSIYRYDTSKDWGFSVRCIKDN